MKTLPIFATALALSMATAGLVWAEDSHGHGAQAPDTGTPASDVQTAPMAGEQAAMMGNMMQTMMPMMMRMHAQMMGAGGMQGMAMMDRDMMQMMMGPAMMGSPSAGETGTMMQSRLAEFDADGDGSLSLAEFEALHAAMIREMTVDRFQHLDADGDGRITANEMGAPARRMEMRGMTNSATVPGTGN